MSPADDRVAGDAVMRPLEQMKPPQTWTHCSPSPHTELVHNDDDSAHVTHLVLFHELLLRSYISTIVSGVL